MLCYFFNMNKGKSLFNCNQLQFYKKKYFLRIRTKNYLFSDINNLVSNGLIISQ